MLEEVAAASLDQAFKDELNHVNQWFRCRSDPERTAAFYSVLQNASQIQIRFLITVLQQLANQDPLGELLSPAGQEKGKKEIIFFVFIDKYFQFNHCVCASFFLSFFLVPLLYMGPFFFSFLKGQRGLWERGRAKRRGYVNVQK